MSVHTVHIGNFVRTVIDLPFKPQCTSPKRLPASACHALMRQPTKGGVPSQGLDHLCRSAPDDLGFCAPRPCSGFYSSLLGRPRRDPRHNCTHIVICSMDTNRCGALARLRLVGSATPTDASAADGHGVAFNRQTHAFPADVLLASLHPCQQAARHLPCTRPPDFVDFQRSFTVLLATAPSSSSCTSFLLGHPRRTPRRPLYSTEREPPKTPAAVFDTARSAQGLRAAFIRRTTSSPLPALLATFFDADCTDYADVRAHIAIAQADEVYTKAIILVIHRRRRRLILIYDVDDHEGLE